MTVKEKRRYFIRIALLERSKPLFLHIFEEDGLPASKQIDKVMRKYPEAKMIRFCPGETTSRSAEVKINLKGESITIFISPEKSNLISELNDSFMDRIEEFHGELMYGIELIYVHPSG